MGCHMCWTEFYRMCDVREKETRAKQGAIKVRIKELMDKGCMYGEAVWIATFGVGEDATYDLRL